MKFKTEKERKFGFENIQVYIVQLRTSNEVQCTSTICELFYTN